LRYDTFVGEQIGRLPVYNQFLLLVMDVHRRFEGDYDAAVRFCADIIATDKSEEDIEKLRGSIPFFKLMFKLIDYLYQKPPEDEETSAAHENDFRNIINHMLTQGATFEMLKRIVSLFGFEGGRPGRHAKDISPELYKLRAGGKKWREVAEYNLQNDPDTSEEFGGRKFAQLGRDQQWTLMRRVRELLRGFAKRTGKPFPPKKEIE
jgi:hypothetical protein